METKVELREWHALTPAQQTGVGALTISAAQERYAGNIAKAIDDCRANPPDRLRGFAVLAGGKVVGFVTLKRPPLSPPWTPDDAVSLHGLQIDRRLQGRGYGAASFRAALAAARRCWPEAKRLVLSVDSDNQAAWALYLKCGMADEGRDYQGRIGLERRFALALG